MIPILEQLEPYWTMVGAVATVVALIVTAYSIWVRPGRDQRRYKDFGLDLFPIESVRYSTRYYVKPNCCSVDPASESEIRNLVTAEEPLFKVVDRFLSKAHGGRYLFVLADSGMGKSSFLINYFARNLRRGRRKRHRLNVVPLGVPDGIDRLKEILIASESVLFLDAFDEDILAIRDHRSRLSDLMDKCQPFGKVIITCRTQFFPSDEELPMETGLLRVGPRRASEAGTYEFKKLYLAPFSDRQVRQYLRKRFPIWRLWTRLRAWAVVKKVPLLSVRPMLLTHIPDLLDASAPLRTLKDVYRAMIEAWIKREEGWSSAENLKAFSIRLAANIFQNRERRGEETISRDELEPLAQQWDIDLESWQLAGRSLLNRNAAGDYKFAHRSIMEFLVTEALAGGHGDVREYSRLLYDEIVGGFQAAINAKQDVALNTSIALMPILTDMMANFLGSDADQEIVIRVSDLEVPDRRSEMQSADGRYWRGRILLQGTPVHIHMNGDDFLVQETMEIATQLTIIAIVGTTDLQYGTTNGDGQAKILKLGSTKSDHHLADWSGVLDKLRKPISPLVRDTWKELGRSVPCDVRVATETDLRVVGQSRYALCNSLHRTIGGSRHYIALARY